jgi:large subunit ribosomal protein L19e
VLSFLAVVIAMLRGVGSLVAVAARGAHILDNLGKARAHRRTLASCDGRGCENRVSLRTSDRPFVPRPQTHLVRPSFSRTPSSVPRRLDPAESSEISLANSRQAVRKLYKDGLIIRLPAVVHSRSRKHARDDAVAKGRHTGMGKRRGTRNARLPYKVIWVRRLRVLRRMLKKYRAAKKIDKHLYHSLYLQVKGNKYKTKRTLMETIHKLKAEKTRAKGIEDQAAAAKAKAAGKKGKKEA